MAVQNGIANLSCPASPATEANGLARRVVGRMAETVWRAGKVQLALQASQLQAWALVEPEYLEQVLVNLLHAALCRALPGDVILIRVERQAQAVILHVCDSSERPHPISQRLNQLVERMNAELSLTTIPGEGSCLAIRLPPATADAGRAPCSQVDA